jgi:hypothetical protein
MATAEGYVMVYESSDGGTGDPAKTRWQFFVGDVAVSTDNHFLAETVRLAIDTNSRVQVTHQDGTASQVRIEFAYVCETRRQALCGTDSPPGKAQPSGRSSRSRSS